MIKEEFEKILAEINETDMNNYPVRDLLVEKAINLFSENIQDAILFIKQECNGLQFILLSEFFDDITEKTKNKDFVNSLEETAKKFPKECEEYYIFPIIQECKEILA